MTASADSWSPPDAAEFDRYYQRHLSVLAGQCEKQRQAAAATATLALALGLGLGGAAGLIAALTTGNYIVGAVILVLGLGVGGAVALAARGKYSRTAKRTVVDAIVRFCGPEFSYSPTGYIEQSEFLACRLFDHSIDRYSGEDLVRGRAGLTRFRFSEVHAEYKTTTTDSKGRRHTQWHTIFKGLFFVADFNKHFHGMTLVLPDVAQRSLGWLGQKLQEWNISRPGQLIKLEDPDFESAFVVYATDQIEARYLLTPSLMRRILECRDRLKAQLHLAFFRENLYVAVNLGRNLLEPALFASMDQAACRRIYEDLCQVLQIIVELNLNLRIWTK